MLKKHCDKCDKAIEEYSTGKALTCRSESDGPVYIAVRVYKVDQYSRMPVQEIVDTQNPKGKILELCWTCLRDYMNKSMDRSQ